MNERFGLRKLSIGLASVLIGIGFINGQKVQADTIDDVPQAETTQKTEIIQGNNTQTDDQIKQHDQKPDLQNTKPTNANDSIKATKTENVADTSKNTQETQNMPVSQVSAMPASNLSESKIQVQNADNTQNGGYDQNTWGTLDVSKWNGNENADGIYELTDYTGNLSHIIIPNQDDFAKAGKTVGQVGINADLTHSWFENGDPKTIAFSKTGDKKVKALGDDWTGAFTGYLDRKGKQINKAHNLEKIDANNLDTSNIYDFSYGFYNNRLTDVSGVSDWDTSMLNTTNGMFYGNSISDLNPIKHWNMSRIISTNYMFNGNQISDLTPVANWDLADVNDISGMFQNNRIIDLTPLKNWDTKNVNNMSFLFFGNQISDLTPLASWNTANVTNFAYMFYNNQISDLTPLANWQTGKGANFSSMFQSNRLTDLSPLANWETSNSTNFSYMFYSNQISDLGPLKKWDVKNGQDFSYMFYTNLINDLTPLKDWDTSGATNFASMFYQNKITNLDALINWQTGKVTNFSSMFANNQINSVAGLKNWDTAQVTNFAYMFQNNQIKDLSPLANWQTDKVAQMQHMFQNNQINNITGLDKWDTSNVTDMSYLFMNNQINNADDLGVWNTSNVTNMASMLQTNKLSDIRKLKNWNTQSVNNFSALFMNNPIEYADFSGWNFDKANAMGFLINSSKQAIILIKDKTMENLLSGNSTVPDWNDGTQHQIVYSQFNNLHFDNDLTTMPKYYVAKDDNDLLTQIRQNVDNAVKNYQSWHVNYNIIPKKDLNTITDPIALSNAEFTLTHKTQDSVQDNPAVRTIVVHYPDGYKDTFIQTIGYERIATKDLVTGKITYGKWTVNDDKSSFTKNYEKQNLKAYKINANGTISFAGFKLPKVNGYKAVVKRVNNTVAVSYLMIKPEKQLAQNPNESISKIENMQTAKLAKEISTDAKLQQIKINLLQTNYKFDLTKLTAPIKIKIKSIKI